MPLLAYGLIALALIGALGGIGYKVRASGYDACKVEWQAADAAAQQKAEADRARVDALRAAQDREATRRLTDEKRRSGAIWASLEAHIRASGTAAQCPIPDSLRDDWNSANAGPQGERTGTVPAASRTAPPAR